MLQGAALFQQQLEQTEQRLLNLRTLVGTKEKACRSLRRRMQNAAQEVKAAREKETQHGRELARWERKRSQCSDAAATVEGLRSTHASVQAELARLLADVAPLRAERHKLRDLQSACEDGGRQQGQRLAELRARCQQEVAELRARQVSELADLQAQQTEELARLQVERQNQEASLQAQHSEETSNLRRSLEETRRRCERLRQECDEAGQELKHQQREGTRLQQQCEDVRQEVTALSEQLRAVQAPPFQARAGMPRSASATMLAAHLDTSMASQGSRDLRVMEAELYELQQRGKTLKQECARSFTALKKGQESCEHLRRRGISGAGSLANRSVRLNPPAAASGGAASGAAGGGTAGRPFALGPSEEEGEERHEAPTYIVA